MKELRELVNGYKEFSSREKEEGRYRYGDLAEGQNPKIMVIGCADSRVLPSQIFNVKPGDLFIVRNVANLVPPFEADDSHHGTSAALEFAVLGLGVEKIIVMGHAQCGGIRACVHKHITKESNSFFIDKWLSLLEPVAQKTLDTNEDVEAQQRLMELAAIKGSLENLTTFPFIKERMDNSTLTIHGAYFDIEDGQLYLLDKEINDFVKID